MGPTEIVPSSQFLSADDQDWSAVNEAPEKLAPNATTIKLTSPAHQPVAVISHHAMIHRGCGRLADENENTSPWRPMLKFIFSRGSGGMPRWNHDAASVRPFAELANEPALVPAMEATWDWLRDEEAAEPAAAASGPAAAELPTREQVSALHAALTAAKATADEAQRVGAAYSLGRYAQRGSDAALVALLDALSSPESSEAARRVSAPGLQAAGSAAVDGLCEILRASTDYRVLMYASDALGEACRTPTLPVVDTLLSTLAKLEEMAAVSPRLQEWAAAAESRRQWDFAEDTAIRSCLAATSRVADRSVHGSEHYAVWAALRDFYLSRLEEEETSTEKDSALSGLVTLAAAPWAREDAPLVEAIYSIASQSRPQSLVHTALAGVQALSTAASKAKHSSEREEKEESKVMRVVRDSLLHELSFQRWSDPLDDVRQMGGGKLQKK
jgi:hypothetical protein